MKIALVTHSYLPKFRGGRESFLYDLSANLIKFNNEVELFVGDDVKRSHVDFYNDVKVHRFPMKTVRVMGFPYRFVSPLFLKSIYKFNPDIIHSLCYRHFTTDLSIIYAKLSKTPIIISVHGLGHYSTSFFNKILWLYDHTLGKLMLGLVDKIVAYPFKDGLEEPLRKFMSKIVFINPAIDVSKFKPGFEPGNIREKYGLEGYFILLNVGRETVNDYKGHYFLLEAYDKLELPKTKLLIVGTKSIEDHGNISLLGALEPESLGHLYRIADVFVQVSKFESCSRVLIEALCHGLPIISTPFGLAPYIISEDVGFLVNHGDLRGFKDAVNKIYIRGFKSHDGAKYVKMFDWKKIIFQFIKVYGDLAKK